MAVGQTKPAALKSGWFGLEKEREHLRRLKVAQVGRAKAKPHTCAIVGP